MSMTSVLEVEDLSIGYNSHLAVDKISFDVQEGDLLGIVGPNGAGKTTLFRAILGLQQYSGKIRLFGFEVFEHVSTRTIFRGKLALFCNVLRQVKYIAEFFKEMLPVLDQRQFLTTMTD